MNKIQTFLPLALILSTMILLAVPVRAQTDIPDTVLLWPDATPTYLVVDTVSTRVQSDGVEVTFTVGNPFLAWYLPFEFKGNPAELELVSEHDKVWDFLKFIPPASITEVLGAMPMWEGYFGPQKLTYRAKFTSVDQSLRIESQAFSVKSAAWNGVLTAINLVLPGPFSADQVGSAIFRALSWGPFLLEIVDNAPCLRNTPPLTLIEGYHCAMGAIDAFGSSTTFRDLLVEVARELGVKEVSREAVDRFIEARALLGKLESMSDFLAAAVVSLWSGQNYSGYTFEPISTRSSPLASETAATSPFIMIPDIQRPDGSGLLITTTVTVPGTPSPLDLIFVIDTTGSMWDDIDQVKAQATELADRIAADVADYRLGLVTYRDHPVFPYGDPGDQPSTVVLPLTTDANAAVDAIQSLIVGGGADWSESVYSGLMAAIDQAWRDGAEKAIILLGDAPPHDPEPFTGYTLDDVLVAAYAVDPANIYPILVGSDPDAAAYFEALAEGSEGQLFAAGDADEVVDALLQALQKIAETKTESVVVFPPPPPMPLCSDIGGLQNTFVRAAIPDGAAGSAMVFCRPLVQNRQYIFTGSAAQIGNADALSLGIIHAVDIYTYDPTGATHPFFSAPVDVCLEGPGALYILGASTSPRILTPVATTAVTADGFTCGSIGQPGILMLVEGTGNSAQNPSSLTAECTLTTTHNLKLRSEPNTSSEVLATLRFDTSLTAIEQVPGWFHVQSPMGVGWVSADYVVPSAGCNP